MGTQGICYSTEQLSGVNKANHTNMEYSVVGPAALLGTSLNAWQELATELLVWYHGSCLLTKWLAALTILFLGTAR